MGFVCGALCVRIGEMFVRFAQRRGGRRVIVCVDDAVVRFGLLGILFLAITRLLRGLRPRLLAARASPTGGVSPLHPTKGFASGLY